MELPQETLGLLLIRAGYLSRSQLYEGLRRQKRTGERIGEALVALGLLSKLQVAETLAGQLGTHLIDADSACELAALHRDLVPSDFVNETGAVPIGERDNHLVFAIADRRAIDALEQTAILPQSLFAVYLVADHEFNRVVAAHQGAPDPELEDTAPVSFHEALEKLYEAASLPDFASCVGLALSNFFNRVAVLGPADGAVGVLATAGFQPDGAIRLPLDSDWFGQAVHYGPLGSGPDQGLLADLLGCDPHQTGLVWLTGGLPGAGLLIYADHAGTDQVYDDLQDLEGLFNEVKTSLELLNNGSG